MIQTHVSRTSSASETPSNRLERNRFTLLLGWLWRRPHARVLEAAVGGWPLHPLRRAREFGAIDEKPSIAQAEDHFGLAVTINVGDRRLGEVNLRAVEGHVDHGRLTGYA